MKHRMAYYTTLAVLGSLLFSCKTLKEYDMALTTSVQNLKQQYAPDRRVAVFDVSWKRTGKLMVVKGEVDNPKAKEDVLAAIRQEGELEILDSLKVLPDEKLGNKTYGIVTLSVGNVRTDPDQGAELATQVMMGMVVKLLKKQGGWYYVQSPDQYLGWLEDDAMWITTVEGVDAWRSVPKAITTAYFGIVREQPTSAALPVCDVVAGAMLKSKGSKGGWMSVELPDGRSGYVEPGVVEEYTKWRQSRKLSAENVEKAAKMFMGVPYLWGGTSPKGVDCSGFTKVVYRLNGLELTRDANQQAMMGDEVPLDESLGNLRKGDLLFFGRKATAERPERITHVGIYLDTKKFIHSSGRVKINSFDPAAPDYDEFNHKRLVRAKRVIGTVQVPEVAHN